MAVASEQPPWEIGSAIPGAQVHTSLCDVKPKPPTIFIFSDDSNFRAPTDRRITFSCLPLPLPAMGERDQGQFDRASSRSAEVFPFGHRPQSPGAVKR